MSDLVEKYPNNKLEIIAYDKNGLDLASDELVTLQTRGDQSAVDGSTEVPLALTKEDGNEATKDPVTGKYPINTSDCKSTYNVMINKAKFLQDNADIQDLKGCKLQSKNDVNLDCYSRGCAPTESECTFSLDANNCSAEAGGTFECTHNG